MKTKIIYSLIAIISASVFASCSEDPDKVAAWRETYADFKISIEHLSGSEPHLLFSENVCWYEATYEAQNPENYKLHRYEVTHQIIKYNNLFLTVNKDSVYYGDIIMNLDGKVYFRQDGENLDSQLYDFQYVIDNCTGEVAYPASGQLWFQNFADNQYYPWDKYPVPTMTIFYYPSIQDEYGGVTAVYLGSTAGFFTPIDPISSGERREMILAYNTTDTLLKFGFLLIKYDSPVLEYIPEDNIFWKYWEEGKIGKD